jgi:hypothetical protein
MPKYHNPKHRPSELEVGIFRVLGYRANKPHYARILCVVANAKATKQLIITTQIAALIKAKRVTAHLWVRDLERAGFLHLSPRTYDIPGWGYCCRPVNLTQQSIDLIRASKAAAGTVSQ